jgi:hypothetical protein
MAAVVTGGSHVESMGGHREIISREKRREKSHKYVLLHSKKGDV